jgi:hypothetical protein
MKIAAHHVIDWAVMACATLDITSDRMSERRMLFNSKFISSTENYLLPDVSISLFL